MAVALDLSIGAKVKCRDESCGNLLRLVVDPDADRLTDLIVGKGSLGGEAHVVPVSRVLRTSADAVYLSISADELMGYPRYRETYFREPAPGVGGAARYRAEQALCWVSPWQRICFERAVVPMIERRLHEGVSPGQEVIGRGTKVWAEGSEIGEIDHVLVDSETGKIRHLVVALDVGHDYPIVPQTAIQEVTDEAVALDVTRNELEALPTTPPEQTKMYWPSCGSVSEKWPSTSTRSRQRFVTELSVYEGLWSVSRRGGRLKPQPEV